MNELTKKELEFLLMCARPFHWLWHADPMKLEDKIKSMIDNYCEHNPLIHCKCEGKWVCDDCALIGAGND